MTEQDFPNSVGDEAAYWQQRQREPRTGWRIVGACLLIAAIIVIGISIARAAERDTARPHEIVLLLAPDPDRRSIITISGAYADRSACEKAKRRVSVMAKGAKVLCFPTGE